MFPAKNLVLEFENTHLKPLFKRILIFEKKIELGIKILNFRFFMPFLHKLLRSKYAMVVDFAVLDQKLRKVDIMTRMSYKYSKGHPNSLVFLSYMLSRYNVSGLICT